MQGKLSAWLRSRTLPLLTAAAAAALPHVLPQASLRAAMDEFTPCLASTYAYPRTYGARLSVAGDPENR